MRISAKGEYAIKAVLDLALHRDRDLIPIQEIAMREAIPQRYLEQVLLSLKRAGADIVITYFAKDAVRAIERGVESR